MLHNAPPSPDYVLSPRLIELLAHPVDTRVWKANALPSPIGALLSDHFDAGASLDPCDVFLVWYRNDEGMLTAKCLASNLGSGSWWCPNALTALYPEGGFVFIRVNYPAPEL